MSKSKTIQELAEEAGFKYALKGIYSTRYNKELQKHSSAARDRYTPFVDGFIAGASSTGQGASIDVRGVDVELAKIKMLEEMKDWAEGSMDKWATGDEILYSHNDFFADCDLWIRRREDHIKILKSQPPVNKEGLGDIVSKLAASNPWENKTDHPGTLKALGFETAVNSLKRILGDKGKESGIPLGTVDTSGIDDMGAEQI